MSINTFHILPDTCTFFCCCVYYSALCACLYINKIYSFLYPKEYKSLWLYLFVCVCVCVYKGENWKLAAAGQVKKKKRETKEIRTRHKRRDGGLLPLKLFCDFVFSHDDERERPKSRWMRTEEKWGERKKEMKREDEGREKNGQEGAWLGRRLGAETFRSPQQRTQVTNISRDLLWLLYIAYTRLLKDIGFLFRYFTLLIGRLSEWQILTRSCVTGSPLSLVLRQSRPIYLEKMSSRSCSLLLLYI